MWLSGLSAACELKGRHFDSQSGHVSGFLAGLVPSWGRVRGNQLMCLLHIAVSSSPLPLSLKVNKIFKNKRKGVIWNV